MAGDTLYAVVAYDANPEEQAALRTILIQQLHWVQNSTFAGDMTQIELEHLVSQIRGVVEDARVTVWCYDRPPEAIFIGKQKDQESMFL